MRSSKRQKATMVECDHMFLKLREEGKLVLNETNGAIFNTFTGRDCASSYTYLTEDKEYSANTPRIRKLFFGIIKPGELEEKRKFKVFV